MDNETMHQSIKLEQNTLKNFFKQFIEETKNSTEIKLK